MKRHLCLSLMAFLIFAGAGAGAWADANDERVRGTYVGHIRTEGGVVPFRLTLQGDNRMTWEIREGWTVRWRGRAYQFPSIRRNGYYDVDDKGGRSSLEIKIDWDGTARSFETRGNRIQLTSMRLHEKEGLWINDRRIRGESDLRFRLRDGDRSEYLDIEGWMDLSYVTRWSGWDRSGPGRPDFSVGRAEARDGDRDRGDRDDRDYRRGDSRSGRDNGSWRGDREDMWRDRDAWRDRDDVRFERYYLGPNKVVVKEKVKIKD